MTQGITVFGVEDLPEITRGADLAVLIISALERQQTPLAVGDVVIVTQKIVSKAEGRVVSLRDVAPSPLAIEAAKEGDKDPRHVEMVLRESKRILRMSMGVLISETRHGFKCANAGVDASNIPGEESVSLLPEDPDRSARQIRDRMRKLTGRDVAVIISDTFGRPWREGAANVAIGVAGISPLKDYRGSKDSYGRELRTSVIAVADELAGAAELVTNKTTQVPVAIVRGYPYSPTEGSAKELLRPSDHDLFP